MLDNEVVLLVGYVLPLAVLWASIIWMRPIVARARVQRKAEAIHDELMDAIFRGEIDADNPRAIDALTYSEFLAKSAHELCISAVVAADMAADHVGYDLSTKFKERKSSVLFASRGKATAAGDTILENVEDQLDQVVAWFFVRGTVLWPILVPMQIAVRFLRKQSSATAEHISKTIDQPRPGELATEIRESARGARSPLPEFMSHFQPGADRDLIPA